MMSPCAFLQIISGYRARNNVSIIPSSWPTTKEDTVIKWCEICRLEIAVVWQLFILACHIPSKLQSVLREIWSYMLVAILKSEEIKTSATCSHSFVHCVVPQRWLNLEIKHSSCMKPPFKYFLNLILRSMIITFHLLINRISNFISCWCVCPPACANTLTIWCCCY